MLLGRVLLGRVLLGLVLQRAQEPAVRAAARVHRRVAAQRAAPARVAVPLGTELRRVARAQARRVRVEARVRAPAVDALTSRPNGCPRKGLAVSRLRACKRCVNC